MKYRIKKIEDEYIPQVRFLLFFWNNISGTSFCKREYAIDWIKCHIQAENKLNHKPEVSFEYIKESELKGNQCLYF